MKGYLAIQYLLISGTAEQSEIGEGGNRAKRKTFGMGLDLEKVLNHALFRSKEMAILEARTSCL